MRYALCVMRYALCVIAGAPLAFGNPVVTRAAPHEQMITACKRVPPVDRRHGGLAVQVAALRMIERIRVRASDDIVSVA